MCISLNIYYYTLLHAALHSEMHSAYSRLLPTLYTTHCTNYTINCNFDTTQCILHTTKCTALYSNWLLLTAHCQLSELVQAATGFTPGLHKVYTGYSSDLNHVLKGCTQSLHWLFTWLKIGFHRVYTRYLFFTRFIWDFHRVYTRYTPGIHQS